MADEDINIKITADDLTSGALSSAKKNVESMGQSTGRATEAARLGYWTMGEAAENAAQSMGVPNQMSRQLGNAVEGLAGKMGKLAMGFGLLGLAVAAGITIWKSYREEQDKIREGKIKDGQMAGSWIEAQTKEKGATLELVAAKKSLLQAEFDLNKARIDQALPAMIEQLKILTEDQARFAAQSRGEATLWWGSWEDAAKKADEASGKIKKLGGEIGVLRAQQRLYTAENKAGLGDSMLPKKENMMSSLDEQVAEFKRVQALKDEETAKAATQAETIKQIERDKYNSIQQLRLEDMENRRQVIEMEWQLEEHKITMLQGVQQVMGQVYEIGGKKMKAFFYLQQAAAASEAFINYQLAAAKAVGQTGLFGIPMAGYFTAMSYIVPSLIMAKSFIGGATGGGGAQGTFSANPSTNLPATTPASSGPSFTFIIEGKRMTAEDLARDIDRNNGQIGNIQLSYARI